MNQITTLCGNCVFAVFKNNHQTDCKFDRLEKFKENGGIKIVHEKYVDIKEVVDGNIKRPREYTLEEYNYCRVLCQFTDGENLGVVGEPEAGDENSYYAIPRYCNKCRDSDWAEKQNDDLIESVNKESALQLTILIYIDENTLLQDLELCIQSIKHQTLKPIEVIIINNFSRIKVTSLIEVLEECGTAWQHLKIHEKNIVKFAALEEGYMKLNGKFFAEMRKPCVISPTFVQEIDELINEKLERCALIEYDNPDIFVTQVATNKHLEGNAPTQMKENSEYVEGLKEKIKWLAKENNQEFILKTLKV